MKKLIWNGIALMVSIGVTGLGIMAVQMVNHSMFPLPEGVDITTIKDLESLEKLVPISSMLIIVLSYLVGSLAGGYILGKLAPSHHLILGALLGGLFTLTNIVNIMNIPHPIWMIVLTMMTFIPAVFLGLFLARK